MTLRQKQETIDSLNEMLESRDQLKAEKELVEQNNKLLEEINRYRKREHQLKLQLNGEQQKAVQRRSKFDASEVAKLLFNLDIKKTNILKDIDGQEPRNRLTSVNADQRKLAYKNHIKEFD